MKKYMIKNKNKFREVVVYEDNELRLRKELKEKLEKYFIFPPCVFSFIKGRSAKDAIILAKEYINQYDYFFKCDIKDFFPSINIEKLMNLLRKRVNDVKFFKELEKVIIEDNKIADFKGLPLGSPLSPILSNVYLEEFDNYFYKNKKIRYLRFCDDMIFFSNANIYDEIINKLKELGLNLNETKTILGAKGDSVKFLGIIINFKKVRVDDDKMRELASKNLNIPGYYNNLIDNNDLVALLDSVKNKDEEKFISVLSELNKELLNDNLIERLKKKIEVQLGEKHKLAFQYILFNNKDEIIEKLVEENKFYLIEEFEELIRQIENKNKYIREFIKLFSGRKSVYFVSQIGNKDYQKIYGEIDDALVKKHFNGLIILAVRLDCENGTSNKLVFDIDCVNDVQKAFNVAKEIKRELMHKGYEAYIEFSGKKGYHVWIFFKETIKINLLEKIAKEVLENVNYKDVNIEIKPKENIIVDTENVIKLPLGLHPETCKRTEFLEISSLKDIKLNEYYSYDDGNVFFENLRQNYNEAYKIAVNCKVIKYLLENGIRKKHLTHFERLLLLYVFNYIEKGKDFIHFLMSQMDNYSFNITEKFINKAPERPISCKKIREYMKDNDIISECCCKFEIPEGVYSSPILYSDNAEFFKTSVELSIKEVVDEVLKLKSQREELDKKITHLERKLNVLFNILGKDEVNIDIGKLKRIRENEESKWIIDIKF